MFEGLIGGGLSALGSLFSGNSASDAAEQRASAERAAAQQAANAMRFKPVGVTGSPFGTAGYNYDARGNLTGASYTPTTFTQAQQAGLMGATPGMLGQFTGSQAATAPMGQAAQTMFGLGQGYLSTSPQQQAAQYMAEQQALVEPGRAQSLAELQNKLAAQGRMGIATGGGTAGMMATNPEMAAYYNAMMQQDREMAARATQGGMDYAKFGAGMVGSGGQMLQDMYGTQSAALAPWQTAMKGIQYTDELAQQPMQGGMQYGGMLQPSRQAAAGALQQGMSNAANYQYAADAYSPWGALLSGAGNAVSRYGQPQAQVPQSAFEPWPDVDWSR